MKNLKGCMMHEHDNWKTPKQLYDPIMEIGCFDLFPYLSEYDELKRQYKNSKLYCNPPYSKLKTIKNWIQQQIMNNKLFILLIPARTDTYFFHEMCNFNPKIIFIKGRLHFNESKSAPFPSVVMIFEKERLNNKEKIWHHFTIEETIRYLKLFYKD